MMEIPIYAFFILITLPYAVGYVGGKTSAKYDILELKMKLQYAELKKEER